MSFAPDYSQHDTAICPHCGALAYEANPTSPAEVSAVAARAVETDPQLGATLLGALTRRLGAQLEISFIVAEYARGAIEFYRCTKFEHAHVFLQRVKPIIHNPHM